jgi:hypothetical protein
MTTMREPPLPTLDERRAASTRLLAGVTVPFVLPGVLMIVFRAGFARLLRRLRYSLLVRARA